MAKKTEQNTFVVTSLLLVIVFVLGVVVGKGNESSAADMVPAGIVNAESEEGVDFQRFWQAWQTLDGKYPFDEPTAEEKMYGAIQGLARSYEDPYTVFLPPQESESFNEDISGEFSGVGMEIGIRDNALTVVAPLKGTPAEAAGLRSGDIIYEIDGETAVDLSIDNAVQKIRGPRGTSVTLTIIREGEFEPLEIKVVRDLIEIPTLETELTEDNIFVIDLYNFIGNVDVQFEAAMMEFQRSDSQRLILDLRNNPGGFLQSAINIASWFLPTGEIVVQEKKSQDLEEENVTYRSLGNAGMITKTFDMVILTNQGSASASEIVAGALRPLDWVTLIGEQTFGKGSVQELVPMSGDTSLKITVAKWYTPDGTSISEEGLSPEIEVEFTREDYEEGIDPQFEKAVEHLLGQ